MRRTSTRHTLKAAAAKVAGQPGCASATDLCCRTISRRQRNEKLREWPPMRLEPFVRVDGTPFATSRDDVLRARGVPLRQGRNAVGLTELDYDDVVYRFQDSGRLEEVTSRAAVLVMGSVAVPFRSLEAFVRAQDP